MLVDAGEGLLEDVLGVVLGEPVGLHADGVDVAVVALDELGPGRLLARQAAPDDLGVVRHMLCGDLSHVTPTGARSGAAGDSSRGGGSQHLGGEDARRRGPVDRGA